jgi:hypothetical protein
MNTGPGTRREFAPLPVAVRPWALLLVLVMLTGVTVLALDDDTDNDPDGTFVTSPIARSLGHLKRTVLEAEASIGRIAVRRVFIPGWHPRRPVDSTLPSAGCAVRSRSPGFPRAISAGS